MENNGHDDPRKGKTSASSAQADELCPGRHLAQLAARSMLNIEERPDASRGTRIHEALATQDPKDLTSDELKNYELCQRCENDVLVRYFGPDVVEATKRVWRHKRIWGTFNGFEHSGELDVCYRFQNRLLVIEYKTLFGDVPEPATNKQLRDQAVLAWKHFFLIEEVAVTVIQPEVSLNPDICVYNREALVRSEADMGKRIAASYDTQSLRCAGEYQCNFCDARRLCKQYEMWAASKLPAYKSHTEIPMKEWTPAQWAIFCDNMGPAYKWLDLGKAEAKARLKADPQSIPGYHLRPGKKIRDVVDVNQLYSRFEKLGGKLEDFHLCIKVVLERLEEQLRKVTGAKGKGLDKAMDIILKGVIEEKETDQSIAKTKE